ncbi:MAG: ABC transporter ATP-binding protein [bacterium]
MSDRPQPILTARDVALRLGGQEILRGATLTAHPGEVTALVGPNGAGKSTLIRVLAGLLKPNRGEVTLRGRPLRSYTPRELGQTLALVPQDTRVDADFPVGDFVAMGRYPHLGRFRPPGPDDRRFVAEAMEAAEVSALHERLMPTLSGGERQRVFLSRAWATRAPVILLDEPTANLDVRHALQFHQALARLVAEGRGALVAMHELNAALRHADRVAVMDAGVIVAEGSPAETLTEECLRDVFGVKARRVTGPDGDDQLFLSLEN